MNLDRCSKVNATATHSLVSSQNIESAASLGPEVRDTFDVISKDVQQACKETFETRPVTNDIDFVGSSASSATWADPMPAV